MSPSFVAGPPMFPAVAFDTMDDDPADAKLVEWGHYLEECNRPFGRQSFGLWLDGELVAVAVSASTVNETCGGHDRREVVELARLCSHPDHADLTRVCLRLWRKIAATRWTAQYWRVRWYVSYSNALRHSGAIYRFDGWRHVERTRGGKSGPNSTWTPGALYDPKDVWDFEVPA